MASVVWCDRFPYKVVLSQGEVHSTLRALEETSHAFVFFDKADQFGNPVESGLGGIEQVCLRMTAITAIDRLIA
jgi:hypothetical protein